MTQKSTHRLNEISGGWAVAGAALFAVAVATPFGVLQMADKLSEPAETLAEGKASATGIVDANAAVNRPDIKDLFADALIVPGAGVGPVALGQNIETVLRRLPDSGIALGPADQPDAPRRIAFQTGTTRVDIDATGGRVSRVAMSAADCMALAHPDSRDQDVPSTADGLSLGSHLSRVIAVMGVPSSGAPKAPIPGPMPLPAQMTYDGISFQLCPGNGLVNAISLDRTDDVQIAPVPVATLVPSTLAGQDIAAADPAISRSVDPAKPAPDAMQPADLVANAAQPVALTPTAQPDAPKSPQDLPLAILPLQPGTLLALAPVGDEVNTRSAPAAPGLDDTLAQRPQLPARLADATRPLDQSHPLAAVKAGGALPTSRAHPQAALAGVPAADRTQPRYDTGADELVTLGPVDRLFTPGPAPSAVNVMPMQALLVAEAAETDLQLDRRAKVNLQRRLSLLGYDPKGVDGIFGRNTRLAIMELQEDNNLVPTGFVNLDVKQLILTRSDAAYKAWNRERRAQQLRNKRTQKKRKLRPSAAPRVAAARPQSRPQLDRGCSRSADGLIKANQSVGCDVEYLVEDIGALIGISDRRRSSPGS